MGFMRNIQSAVKSKADNNIFDIGGSDAPVDGTSGTAFGICGPGSTYARTDGTVYLQTGTKDSPVWTLVPTGEAGTVTSAMIDESVIQVITTAISAANIIAMNGAPVEVVAAPGAGKAIQFIDGVLIYDRATATYGGGGDITLEYSGGAAVTTTIAKTDGFGAAGDKVFSFAALNAAGGYTMPVNTAIDITNATGAFTNPGTAAGIGSVRVAYRVITTGL
jgi:hypothetical protein